MPAAPSTAHGSDKAAARARRREPPAEVLPEPGIEASEELLPAPGKERQGQIYTWGFCTHGQLGLKETVLGMREYVEVPTHAGPGSVLRDVELKTVACGHFHTLAVDVNGNVYAFGRNDRGQLGRGGEADSEDVSATHGAVPRRLRGLARSIITSVTCGAFHCLARTADGAAISWGWNKYGQLGRLTAYQTDSEPDFVREAKEHPGLFKALAAGFAHSAAVLSSGQVLAWGSNESGQLGVGSVVRHPEVAYTPLPVPGVVAQQVAAGDNHLLVLSTEGKVFATGDASYGRLGIGIETAKAAKKRAGHVGQVLNLPWAEDPATERIRAISCGGATNAAITTQGRLYTWGGGVWGQLGHGTRTDLDIPKLVGHQGVSFFARPGVRHVDIAQDHMLAICSAASSSTSSSAVKTDSKTTRPSSQDRGEEEAAASDDDVVDARLTSSRLWVWGRRQLLPPNCCTSSDPEAQSTPVEVPYGMLGSLGALHAKGAQVNLLAVCGGSHSIVIGVPSVRADSKKRYEAVRCPAMSSVTGPGTRGGAISDPLAFRIASRDEEGRDEKVGGLRFCVWASPISEIRARRTIGRGEGLTSWDTHPFELQRISDCTNGTYDGAYIIRRPGLYFFHVRMLRPGEEVDIHADIAELSRLDPGDPVSGSPFKVEIQSGPAYAPLCIVELHNSSPRGVKRRRNSPARKPEPPANQEEALAKGPGFMVEASTEAMWDICAYDLFGNAVTFNTDRFSAYIKRQDSDASAILQANAAAAECSLADDMGLPKVSRGRSSAADEIRERVRQRKAEAIWTRMSSTFTQSFGASANHSAGLSPRGAQISLHVNQAKEPGIKEIRWVPDAVGRYELHVAQLSTKRGRADQSPHEEPLAGSPFNVIVIPGKPSASHSRLLVGLDAVRLPGSMRDADTPPCPVLMSIGDPPHADIPIRLLLCDRMGNVCQESLDALQTINVRVENVRLVGVECQYALGSAPLLESQVVPGACKGLLCLQLRASPALLRMAAQADADGVLRDATCIVQLFVSATDTASRQRLLGSPARLQLELEASSWANALPAAPPEVKPLPLAPPAAPPNVVAEAIAEAAATLAAAAEAETFEAAVVDALPSMTVTDRNPAMTTLDTASSLCRDASGALQHVEPIVDSNSAEGAREGDALDDHAAATNDGEQRSQGQSPRSPPWKVASFEGSPVHSGRKQKVAEEDEVEASCADVPVTASILSAAMACVAQSVASMTSRAADGDSQSSQRLAEPSEDPLTNPFPQAVPPAMMSPKTSTSLPLPLPACNQSCSARTQPAGEPEPDERRSLLVQLPPLSPSHSQPPSAARAAPLQTGSRRSSSKGSPAVDDPEHSAPGSSRARAQARKPLDSGRALSWLPASGLAAPDRKAGTQTASPAVARRRAPALSAGLVRVGALTSAPSPWPQPR